MPLINSVFIFLFRSFLNYAFLKKKNQAQIPTIVWSNLWFAAGLSIYDQYKIIKLQLFTFFSTFSILCHSQGGSAIFQPISHLSKLIDVWIEMWQPTCLWGYYVTVGFQSKRFPKFHDLHFKYILNITFLKCVILHILLKQTKLYRKEVMLFDSVYCLFYIFGNRFTA